MSGPQNKMTVMTEHVLTAELLERLHFLHLSEYHICICLPTQVKSNCPPKFPKGWNFHGMELCSSSRKTHRIKLQRMRKITSDMYSFPQIGDYRKTQISSHGPLVHPLNLVKTVFYLYSSPTNFFTGTT